ncbi:hypothetical protein DUI87_15609 [Hirundo rustica rustica]|uniref:Uncharacterized protein n=1 Tax=Hirundo rustica rustica TaxID=333673 RepID=A0A3M0JZ23_HIRRU|nr:hypothetical protein DUI87_15609 [Hirundo rustica rustica]
MTSSVYKGRELDIVFLNSSKAFHSVSLDVFIAKPVRYGLDKRMIRADEHFGQRDAVIAASLCQERPHLGRLFHETADWEELKGKVATDILGMVDFTCFQCTFVIKSLSFRHLLDENSFD